MLVKEEWKQLGCPKLSYFGHLSQQSRRHPEKTVNSVRAFCSGSRHKGALVPIWNRLLWETTDEAVTNIQRLLLLQTEFSTLIKVTHCRMRNGPKEI